MSVLFERLFVDCWWLNSIANEKNNHETTLELKDKKSVRSLNPNDSSHLCDLTDCLVPPRHIFTYLRNRNGWIATTIEHIYNACYKYRQSCVKNKHVYHYRMYAYFDDIKGIFVMHSESIKLFNTFSHAFALDSTYKTNIYCLLCLGLLVLLLPS